VKLPWGLRWWELIPEVLLAAGLTLFLVTDTSAALSALKSGTAIRLMVIVGLAWLLVRFVLVRFTRWPLLRVAVFGAAAAGVLAVVVLPAYDDETVVEALPLAAPQVAPDTTVTTTTTTTTAVAVTTTTTAVPVTTPAGAPEVESPTTTVLETTTTTTATSTTVPPAPTTTVPADPVVLRSGEIHGIDHRAEGRAVIYRLSDGALVVGLEEIDIQPGPDYDVYVVPGPDRESVGDGVRLDDLRGNKGTQYYLVPPEADISTGEWTVLVWCQTFDVPVAGSTPAPV
jgi:hypothetical protein